MSPRAAAVLLTALALTSCGRDAPAPTPPQWPDRWGVAQSNAAQDPAEKRERRERLAKLAGPDAAVLVLAADDSPGFTGSTQNCDFAYLSPFDIRGAALLVSLAPGVAPSGVPVLYDPLYLRPKNPAGEIWTGATAGPGVETRAAGLLCKAFPIETLADELAQFVQSKKTLYVSAGGPSDGSKLLAPVVAALRAHLPGIWIRLVDAPGSGPDDLAESIRRALPQALPRGKSPSEIVAALPAIDVRSASRLFSELRETKSATETARIRAACAATAAGMMDALRAAKPGMIEMQVAALVELRCRLAGCARQAYPSIVGSGPNSCVLHYAANTRVLADGDLVVMDIGGEYQGYASDVTRTFPANGHFTEEQSRVYDAVLDAQAAGIAKVMPGATIAQIHAAACSVLTARGLVQYFPHGTSHSVGLDVHDPHRPDAPLAVGAVITVEPGVYMAEKGLGVRIEDTVLVTADGCEVLSAAVPKTRDAIEKLMAEDPRLPADAR